MTVISDVYFDVSTILSKWMRHQIIKLLLEVFLLGGDFSSQNYKLVRNSEHLGCLDKIKGHSKCPTSLKTYPGIFFERISVLKCPHVKCMMNLSCL